MKLLLLLAALSSLACGQITLNISADLMQAPDAAPEVPINVIEGESVTFRCLVFLTLQSRPPGSSNFGIELPSNLRAIIIDPLTVEFQNATRNDNGTAFQCRGAGGFTEIGVINVLFPPNYTSPGPQTITEGDTNAQINVTTDANPFPSSFTWSRNGVPITSSSNVALTATSITFTTVQQDNAGTYTVYSNNTAGSDSTTFELIVQFPPAVGISQGSLSCRGNVFTVCAIMTDATGYLECSAVGVPTPKMTLTTDAAVSNNVMVSDNRFTITSAVAGNAGNYTCNASNFLGFDKQTIELLVGGAPTLNNLMINVTSDTEVVITWTFNDNGVPIDPFQVTTTCRTLQPIISPVDVPTMGYKVTFTQNLPPDLPSGSKCRVRVAVSNLFGNDTVENVFTGATVTTPGGSGVTINVAVGIAVVVTGTIAFTVGVLAGVLLYHCIRKYRSQHKPESSSHQQQQTDPEYEMPATSGKEIGLRENMAYDPVQRIELRGHVAYGPVQH